MWTVTIPADAAREIVEVLEADVATREAQRNTAGKLCHAIRDSEELRRQLAQAIAELDKRKRAAEVIASSAAPLNLRRNGDDGPSLADQLKSATDRLAHHQRYPIEAFQRDHPTAKVTIEYPAHGKSC
jgi:NAD(P)H-dependent flavin oxidoreductase YrpB (nitropropane dioxygenase family)